MRNYEIMYILQPGLEEEAIVSFTDSLQAIITDRGGEITRFDRLGIHTLAYPIKHHQQGHYVLMQGAMNQEALAELERILKLSEDQLRYLIIRLEDADQS